MARYEFLMSDFERRRMSETVAARDDDEARLLAELRLLLSHDYSSVAVHCDGRPRFELHRDSTSQRRQSSDQHFL